MIVRRIAFCVAALVAGRASAEPCANVRGDPGLVATLSELLAQRGVDCTTVRARVDRRGDALVVTSDGDAPIERVVGDATTAATVIESWARADLAAPLLATRAVAKLDVAPPPVREIVASSAPPVAQPRGVQLFADAETSVANDRTTWLGMQLGVCVMVGPVCTAARVRFANVAGTWQPGLDRRSAELLLGGDVPLRYGRWTLTPGFGGGVGSIFTHVDGEGEHMGAEIWGLRADLHAALSYPITHSLALDVSLAFDVTQSTAVETHGPITIPDAPQFLLRLGAGVRYGGNPP